jgi:hypothetical protein
MARFVWVFVSLWFVTIAVTAQSITAHFENWLDANGYASYNFERADLSGGSYGGKASGSDPVVNQPVIFVHGNSDRAVGSVTGLTGWTESIDYFHSKGYSTAELYATTWGPANPALSAAQYHSREYVTRIRAFIEAVLDYTGAAKVDIISHSMGVTLARKAVKGGWASDAAAGGNYYVGSAITTYVDTFVGIAGGNQGLVSCYLSGPTTPTCGSTNGLYPGYLYWGLGPYGVSGYLDELNSAVGYEGGYVYSIWSQADQVIGYSNYVYGERTSRIPGQDGEKAFSSYPYGHVNCKDMTGYYQWRMVRYHSVN